MAKKVMRLEGEQLSQILAAQCEEEVLSGALDSMLCAGVDVTGENGQAFVEKVVAARKKLRVCLQAVIESAREGGYDATMDSAINFGGLANSGVVSWTRKDS